MKPVVVVENVSKKFARRANTHKNYGVKALVKELLGQSQDINLRQDEFLAVDNLSFKLYPGDTFAFIGRNGCGKTTTLKMLNGTLKPDAGKIIIGGRIQALIALGAGFNLRLSGHENIYNAAAVLGLSHTQTRTIIDEIVDFAELEEFIDSPVQTYSSGMYARLGFSVAVHLRPEILLIDEILGVGDFAFQNKCFAKMHQLKKEGVTIILVSHSHSKIVSICEQTLWLHRGKMLKIGPSEEVVKAYIDYLDEQEAKKLKQSEKKSLPKPGEQVQTKNNTSTRLYGVTYDNPDKVRNVDIDLIVNGQKVTDFDIHDEVIIEYCFDLMVDATELMVNFVILRESDGLRLTAIRSQDVDVFRQISMGSVQGWVKISDFNLNPGNYVLVMPILEGHSFLYRNVVKKFMVRGDRTDSLGLVNLRYNYEMGQNGSYK